MESRDHFMPAPTIASHGRNGQKEVCFLSWTQEEKSVASNWGDGGAWKVAETAQGLISGLFEAQHSIGEPTTPDRRLGETGGAGATL
jgi:hypothetical protein